MPATAVAGTTATARIGQAANANANAWGHLLAVVGSHCPNSGVGLRLHRASPVFPGTAWTQTCPRWRSRCRRICPHSPGLRPSTSRRLPARLTACNRPSADPVRGRWSAVRGGGVARAELGRSTHTAPFIRAGWLLMTSSFEADGGRLLRYVLAGLTFPRPLRQHRDDVAGPLHDPPRALRALTDRRQRNSWGREGAPHGPRGPLRNSGSVTEARAVSHAGPERGPATAGRLAGSVGGES
jgi:hypothetical protein